MISIKDREFKRLVEYVQLNYGINLIQKRNLIEGRLSNLIIEKGLSDFGEYLNAVFSDKSGSEAGLLINKLTTNHTFFMRETSHFDYYRDKVLPELEKGAAKDRDLRIWSAGCSSGEEPYTLAMLNADFFGEAKGKWDTKILATDISTKVLETAERGIYPAETMNELAATWKQKYFERDREDNFSVSEKIRKEVLFRYFNLMGEQFPFRKKFHVIFCRNVMIYFNNNTKTELVNKFYEHTENGGYLFIGHSESINREETAYKYLMPVVYRKQV